MGQRVVPAPAPEPPPTVVDPAVPSIGELRYKLAVLGGHARTIERSVQQQVLADGLPDVSLISMG